MSLKVSIPELKVDILTYSNYLIISKTFLLLLYPSTEKTTPSKKSKLPSKKSSPSSRETSPGANTRSVRPDNCPPGTSSYTDILVPSSDQGQGRGGFSALTTRRSNLTTRGSQVKRGGGNKGATKKK